MSILQDKLQKYAQHNLNVLLIGTHGIGKTTVTQAVAQDLGLKFKYYSASTLDPFADIVGIPVPDRETKTCEFFRSQDLENAEFIFFDELNRAQPRVLNAVLEIIQFKTVNGVRLPKLKMIWAAINPPGDDYQVEELDPALVDRFHCFIKMMPEINMEYLKAKVSSEVANALKTWWDTILDDHQRKIFTPRRVEYIGMMIDKDLPWKDGVPQGHQFPLEFLSSKIKKIKNGIVDDNELEPTKENIIANPTYFKDKTKLDPKLFTRMAEIISKFDKEDFFNIKDLLEAFPQDLLESFVQKKFPGLRRQIKEFFKEKGFEFAKYPKICRAFEWQEAIPKQP
jgi:hypothetical protein